MKRYLLVLVLATSTLTAQKTNFGLQFSNQSYDISADKDLTAGYGQSSVLIGGFVDHKINESLGVKGSLGFGRITETYYEFLDFGTATPIFDEAEINVLQIQALLKFDVNKSYRKGFFLAGGLRMNNFSGINIEDDPNYENGFYSNSNFALLAGFGTVIAKHFSLDFLFDYGLTSNVKGGYNATSIGGIANLNIDISSMFRKKEKE